MKERSESEDEDNYVGERCRGSGDDEPIYRVLEEPQQSEDLVAEAEHSYLELATQNTSTQ